MTKKRHIIVTGGAGFIGSHIARQLISNGFKVTVIDNLSTGKRENLASTVDFIKLDLGKKSSYETLKRVHCDGVFHLAGQSSGEASFKKPFYDLRSHVLSTYWLLEFCREKKVPRFIYASSMSVYGDPQYLPVDESHPLCAKTFYGAAKASAEAYIKLYQSLGVNTTILRLFSVYGPGQNLGNKKQGMVSIYLSYMLEGNPIIVKGKRERFRDFVYIDDVVEAWLMCFDNRASFGRVYNIASGKKTMVSELVSSLRNNFGIKDYPVKYVEGTPGDQFGVVGDNSLFKKEFGWSPKVDLDFGLGKMIEFEKKKGQIR